MSTPNPDELNEFRRYTESRPGAYFTPEQLLSFLVDEETRDRVVDLETMRHTLAVAAESAPMKLQRDLSRMLLDYLAELESALGNRTAPADRPSALLAKPAIAPAFVTILQVQATQMLSAWAEQHAPAPVRVLVENVGSLWLYESQHAAHPGLVPELLNDDIVETVAETINAITELGGTFHGAEGESMPQGQASQR